MLGVCIAFMYEDSLGERSRFSDYIAVLPFWENQSKFWKDNEKEWLKGSEVDFLGGTDDTEVLRGFKKSVLPILDEFSLLKREYFTYDNFKRAMSIVSSRAFEIDAYRELALVPFADMFDHSLSAHVQFETNYTVCIECGSYQPCEHDRGEENSDDDDDSIMQKIKPIQNHISNDDKEDTCDLLLTKAVTPGEELFNSYGDLGNGVLVSRYGFAIPQNTHSRVRLARELYMYKHFDKPRRVWWKKNSVDAIDRVMNLLSDDENFNVDDEEDGHSFYLNTLNLSSTGIPSVGVLIFLLLLTASDSQFDKLKSVASDSWQDIAQKVGSMQGCNVTLLNASHISAACDLGINACIRRQKKLQFTITSTISDTPSETVHMSRLQISEIVRAEEHDMINKGIASFESIKHKITN